MREISRRTWLRLAAGGCASAVLWGCAGAGDGEEDGDVTTSEYGPEPLQRGDLRVPHGGDGPPPVVVLLHGGFWYPGYERDLMAPLAEDLAGRGYATWNLDYRPSRRSTSGWPYLLDDVATGIDHLAGLATEASVDLDRVVLVGHSAGGQLALWAAARHRFADDVPGAGPRVRPRAVVALAPVADLARAAGANLGTGAVQRFLGGEPEDVPDRYAAASPVGLLPAGTPTLVVHGRIDLVVPVDQSRGYVEAARGAGDPVELVEIEDADHFDVINPEHPAWKAVVDRLPGLLPR